MPPSALARQARFPNPLSRDDVDTTRSREPFIACSGSRWVGSTRTTGEGVATLIQFTPTSRARANAALAWAGGSDSYYNAINERNAVYLQMWRDLNRCAGFSADMTPGQRHVMYTQMACHALYGALEAAGGNTWDLEAWRVDVGWAYGLSVAGGCGRSYGRVDGAGSYLSGRIVNARAYPRGNEDMERRAWLVEPRPGGGFQRRHIQTERAYACLVDRGRPAARWFPFDFLDHYLSDGSEITEAEACAPPPTPPEPSPAPGSPAPPAGCHGGGGTSTGGPGRAGYHIEDIYYGGTWARTDPCDGTWSPRSSRPANGAYWYANGLGVGVDCARTGAAYTVRWADGRVETWRTWFHVTDGKWFPSAAARETTHDSFYGLPAC